MISEGKDKWRRTTSLLVFPVAWVVGLGAVGLANVMWSPLIAAAWGFLCYMAALLIRKAANSGRNDRLARTLSRALHVLAIALIVIVSTLSMFIAGSISWNPIGKGDDLGAPPCMTTDLLTLHNRNEEVATIRRTWCSGNWDGMVSYFVFVHNERVPNSRKNLVFRYTPTDRSSMIAPIISWQSRSSLHITVGPGDILQVTRQQTSMAGVEVTYSLGRAVYSPAPEWWQRPLGPAT